MNVTEKELDNICEVLDNFDFEKVAKVMEFLDWKYCDNNNPRFPDFRELKQKARHFLLDCAARCKEEGEKAILGCRGFFASAEMIEDELFIELQFILTEFNNFY